jgi:hypothetical protein
MYTFYFAWYDNAGGITELTLDFKVDSGSYETLQPTYFSRDNISTVPCIALTTGTTLTTNTAWGALSFANLTPSSISTSGITVTNTLQGGSTYITPQTTNTASFVIPPITTSNIQTQSVITGQAGQYRQGLSGGGARPFGGTGQVKVV